MPEISITKIKVDPAERQREDLGDIEDLAASIKKYGQFNPILLDNDFNLIAGMRRLLAIISLGYDTIKCEFQGDLSESRAQEIELEENIRRKQLEWQEEQKAIKRIHDLKMEQNPNWSVEQTSEFIGKSKRTVYNAIELTKAVEEHPDVASADTPHGAMLRLNRLKQIEERKDIAKARRIREDLGLAKKVEVKIIQGDALAKLREISDETYDMAITNPPYGVDIEHLFKGERAIYPDEETAIVGLLGGVFKELYRILNEHRWFVTFYPTARLQEGYDLLHAAGFTTYQKVPCVWYKPNKFVSALSNPYQAFSIQYETFIWAGKGSPKFNQVRVGNVFVHDTPETGMRVHPLQMPPPLWKDILTIGSVAGENIIEPFAGSGAAGIACVESERNYLGIEINSEYVDRANTMIQETYEGRANFALPQDKEKSDDELLKDLEFTT